MNTGAPTVNRGEIVSMYATTWDWFTSHAGKCCVFVDNPTDNFGFYLFSNIYCFWNMHTIIFIVSGSKHAHIQCILCENYAYNDQLHTRSFSVDLRL